MKTKKLSNIANVNVCLDCYTAIVAGDFTQLDYYYEPPEADKREQAIRRGMDQLAEHGQLVDGNDRNEFSKHPCECCETKKHGERREVAILAYRYQNFAKARVKDCNIPAIKNNSGIDEKETYLTLNKYVPYRQPEALENEEYNAIVTVEGTEYLVASIDLIFADTQIIDQIISIVNERQCKEMNGLLVDLTSANAVKTVWESLSAENKPRYAALFESHEMGIKGAIGYTWELVNRCKK